MQVYRNASTSQEPKLRLNTIRDGYINLLILNSCDHVPMLVIAKDFGAGLPEAFERLRGRVTVEDVRAYLTTAISGLKRLKKRGVEEVLES
jgi:hypothetical protein